MTRLHLPKDAHLWRLWSAWLALALRALGERALWISLLVGLLAVALAYAAFPRPIFADVGALLDRAYVYGFHDAEDSENANFRWSTANSTLMLAGIGKPLAPFPVRLQLSSGPRPGPVEVRVTVNGHPAPPLQVEAGTASYTVQVDPAWMGASGDLRLDFTTTTFRPEGESRELGFIMDFARVELPAGVMLPSLTQMLLLGLCALLIYLILRSAWLAPLPAGLVALAFLLASATVIAGLRLLVTTYTAPLAFTLALALVVGLLGETIARLAARLAGWRGERALPEWAWAGLRGLLMVMVALKVGGLLHPHAFIIDAPFHLRYIGIMAEVGPFDPTFDEELAFAVMPPEEWGTARAFIPYSPFFYVVAAPLTWLPIPISFSVPVTMSVLEVLKVALVFLIGLAVAAMLRPTGSTNRAGRIALTAAAVYAFIPATFLLQQWGNWPTQLSLWLLTLWAAITSLFWERITYLAVWITSMLVLTLALLAYTVTAAYTGIFVGSLVVFGWLFARGDRKRWTALALALMGATALAMLIYYGQHVGRILVETLPTFGQAMEEQGKLTTLRPSVGAFVTVHLARAMQSYHLALPYALLLAGVLLLYFGKGSGIRGQRSEVQAQRLRFVAEAPRLRARLEQSEPAQNPQSAIRNPRSALVWIAAWLLTLPLFTLADFWIDQALKEFWYALPAVALVAGIWLLAMLSRGSSRAFAVLVWLLCATLVWQSLSLWVFRLFFHNRV